MRSLAQARPNPSPSHTGAAPSSSEWACVAWRHPKLTQVQGLCLGCANLKVDRRKAKRLAHQIRKLARLHRWTPCIVTSPLQRCAAVGWQLRRWGWRHVVDRGLLELDFGQWQGRTWEDIGRQAVDDWCADFADHRPPQGETLREFIGRVRDWQAPAGPAPVLLVTHGGWLLARQWARAHTQPPLTPEHWPASPAYGACWVWPAEGGGTQYLPVAPAKRK